MPAKDLIVRVLADTSKFEANLNRSVATSTRFEKTLRTVGVTATESANAQIRAAVRKDARLREEVALYRQIAAASAKGSQEQVAAANLASRAERSLARSLGQTSAEARGLSTSSARAERDIGRATRGALAGAGIFRSFGRSIVFASGGFLAFGGISSFLRTSIDAAKEAQVAEAQLAQQFRNTGRDIEPFRREIDLTTNSISALSGFTNDELKAGLTTILRTQPNVTKALRDEATAADLARAKHESLAKAAQDIARAEGGNLTALRRTLPVFGKHATVEAALAKVRAAVAGQARAGTTEQERFGAVLHNTEEIVGTGLLPTLNKYLAAGSAWLVQMDSSGKLQKDVARDAHDLDVAVSGIADTIKTVDKVTGSFTNTLEIILGLKAASVFARWGRDLGLFAKAEKVTNDSAVVGRINAYAGGVELVGTNATIATGKLATLRGELASMTVGKFLIPVVIGITAEQVGQALHVNTDFSPGAVGANLHHPFRNWKGPLLNWVLGNGWESDLERSTQDAANELKGRLGQSKDELANQVADFFAKTQGFFGTVPEPLGPPNPAPAVAGATAPGGLTATQKNTFFDNEIARILLRGGLGDVQKQISELERANTLIAQRIKATKDVTRRANLEDQLLQNAAQIQSLRAQASAAALTAARDALQKRRDAFDEFVAKLQLGVTVAQTTATMADDIAALRRLQSAIEAEIREFGNTADLAGQLFDVRQQLTAARAQQITGRQFSALGLTPTGDEKIPGIRALKRELASVSDLVSGSFLDTSKTKSVLSGIRRVLSGGLGIVGDEVRAKIQEILGDLNDQLDKGTQKNLTKWRQLSSQAFLAGIPGLTAAQKRQLALRLSTLGPGNTVPASHTTAFAGRTDTSSSSQGDVFMDGEKVGTITKNSQIRRSLKRSVPRSG